MKTNQLLRRPARMAASLTAFVLTFMLAVLPMGKVYAKNYDWQSEYIRADIQGVKIGNLYYDLNTKTHKAAVVFESHPWSGPELGIYNYKNLTSVDVPATVKFQIPLQEEITYDVVEIGTWAFHHVSVDEKFTHLSLPSSIVYIGRNMLYSNSNYIVKWWKHGGYFENYLIDFNDSKDDLGLYVSDFYVEEGTRLIANSIIHGATIKQIYFPEGNIILSGDIFYLDSDETSKLEKVELWGTTIDGYFNAEKDAVTIYNYGGEIDFSTVTYNALKKMYVTRDVARYHTTGRNVQWKDKVELFRFKVGDLYYELLNKDEAVVAYDASYASLSKEIVIPDKVTDNGHTFTVTKIDNEAFKGAAFTKVTLPSTITTVSEGAFSGCTKLTDVAFADEVTTIGKQAFVGCTALKELDLNKVANIAAEAFKGCTTLATMFSSYKGVINAHGMAFDGLNKGNITLQVASNMVWKYEQDSFWKDFNIAANRYKVEGIWYELSGNNAMVVKEKSGEGNYSELTGKVTIPKDVVINGKYYTVTSLEVGAFQYAPFEELDIRCQVTILPEGCCFAMPNLTKVWLPETLVKIDVDAFNSCLALRYFNEIYVLRCADFPNLTTIGESAFANSRLSSVYLNGNVTKVGEYAFFNCTHLQDLILGEKLTTIGKYAFSGCTKISWFHNYAAKPQPYTTGMLEGVSKQTTIRVPFNSLNAYKTADGWKDFRIYAEPYIYWLDEDRYLYFYPDNATLTATITSDDNASSETDNYKTLGNTILEIPQEVELGSSTYTVVAIDEAALKYAPIKKLVLPATIKSIGDEAFSFSAIEEVDFDNISGHECKLGKYAFSHCVNLKEVWVSGYTPRIGEGAFADCFALEKAVIPGGVQEIGKDAFSNCAKLEDLQLPSSLTTIGENAFWNCTSLGSLAIPANVSAIGEQAFKGCTGIYEIYNLNNTPQTITANVFEGLTLSKINLYVPPTRKSAYEAKDVWKNFNVKESKAVVGGLCYMVNPATKTATLTFDELVPMPYAGLSGKVTVPASIVYNDVSYDVTEIGNYAFQSNTTITEIVLPEGIKTIGADCFERMTKLTKVNIPQTVESIFRFESSGNGITQNESNYRGGLLIIDNCLLKVKKDLTGQVDVPEGTRLVAGYAFSGCKELTRISLPETVTEVGPYAFESCKQLGEINLPKGLKVIHKGTFNSCETLGTSTLTLPESLLEIEDFSFWKTVRLTELRFPEGLRKIGDQAFWQSGLKRIWLPASIESIGAWAFADLTVLEEVHIAAPDPSAITLGNGVFDNAPAGAKLYVPYGSKTLYQSAPQWSAFTIEEDNPCIDGFYYVLDKVNHTATLTYETYVEDGAYNHTNYSKLNTNEWTIPAQVVQDGQVYAVTAIGDYAFANTNVEYINLPEGIESIGTSAFDGNGSLKRVILPSTLTSIGQFAFYECRSLSVIYNNAAQPLDIKDKGVFADGTYGRLDVGNIELHVPFGSTELYAAADEWKDFDIEEMPVCIDGVYYYINKGPRTAIIVAQYADNTSNYADLVREVLTIPAAITVDGKEYRVMSVDTGAFFYCQGVKVLSLPEGLEKIWDYAFCNSGFMMITLPSTLEMLAASAFNSCDNLIVLRNFSREPLAVEDASSGYPNIRLHVPAGSKADYEAADFWKDFIVQEMIPCIDGLYYSLDEATGTAQVAPDLSAHAYNDLGKEVVIPESVTVDETTYAVTSIQNTAFMNNTVLEKITLPSRLSVIGWQAFSGCTSLRTIINERMVPPTVDATVFEGLSLSAITLFVHREAVNVYKETDIWKEMGIVSIETPIMIAGQPIRADQYGKPLKNIRNVIEGEVIVTANSVSLGEGAYIVGGEVPAIELCAEGLLNTFFISGKKDAIIQGAGAPAIKVNNNLTLNINTSYDSNETTEGLELEMISDSDEGGIALANGTEVTLYINSTGQPSTNVTNIVANAAIGIPPSAHCDIHAAGEVELISYEDICPIGVFDTRSLTLHGTTMVLPYGGEVKEEGIFDAYGNDCFRLHLSPVTTQSGKAYPVELAGITVTDGNKDDILGDGKASYEPSTNTLTLNDAEIFDNGQVLHATAGLRLEVKGENDLTSISGRSSVEVQGGDFVIFGKNQKDDKLYVSGSNGVQCDQTEQYRMEVKRCNVEISPWGGEFALQTDSLCVNAANLTLRGYYVAPAWLSWNTADDGGLVLKHANKTYGEVNQDDLMEFECQDPLLFKVDVAVDEETHGSVTGGGWYEDGQQVTLTATANEAFKFVRWSDDVTDNPRLLTVDDDYTLKAIFTDMNKYTITFVGMNDVVLGYDYVYEGQAATAPEVPETEGYTFTGWDKDFSHVGSDMTVTAQFKKNTYTVIFLGFEGRELKRETVEYGNAATAPEVPNVEHYTFLGWDKDFSFVATDLTVTAQYELEKLTVTFYGQGGVFLVEQQVPYGGNAVAPAAPYVEGFDFVGWMAPNKEVLSPEQVNAATVVADISYTAMYESNVKTYSLKLEVEGGGKLFFGIYNAFGELQEAEATESEYKLPEGSQFILIAKANEYWRFVQWADGETKDKRNITMTSDLTLKAIFEDMTDAIECLQTDQKVQKILIHGKIYILHNGHVYEPTGQKVK